MTNDLAPLPPLLTVEHVAGACHVSPKTVVRAIRVGELRGSQLARRGGWVIAVEDFHAWLDLRANRPRQPRVGTARPLPPVVATEAPAASRRRPVDGGRMVITTGMGRPA